MTTFAHSKKGSNPSVKTISVKKAGIAISISLLSMGTIHTQGCKKACKDVTCENGGECSEEDGTCQCVEGFSGLNCENAWAAGFIGTWNVSDQGPGGTNTYTSTIDEKSVTEINIINLAGSATIEGNLEGTNEFYIEEQTTPDGKKYKSTGDCVLNSSGNTIVIPYSVTLTDLSVEARTASFIK